MSKEVTRHCPNCKTEIMVILEGRPQGEGAIKKCPGCDSPVLFCSDGYIVQAVTPFASRKQDQLGHPIECYEAETLIKRKRDPDFDGKPDVEDMASWKVKK